MAIQIRPIPCPSLYPQNSTPKPKQRKNRLLIDLTPISPRIRQVIPRKNFPPQHDHRSGKQPVQLMQEAAFFGPGEILRRARGREQARLVLVEVVPIRPDEAAEETPRD